MGRARSGFRTTVRLGVFVVAPLVVVATGWLVYDQGLDGAANWIEVLSFPFAVVAGYLTYFVWSGRRRMRDAAQVHDLDAEAEELADAVRSQWQAEERMLRLQDPEPIPVRWEWTDHVGERRYGTGVVRRKRAGGTVDRIADGYRQIPQGRMVVLGEGGAGKSVLCIRLVLGVLAQREAAGRVPVLVRLASWDPDRKTPWEFVAEQLVADHPSLAEPTVSGRRVEPAVPGPGRRGRRRRRRAARRDTLARALLRSGHVLPVLDGLDEMPADTRPRALRVLNAELNRDDALVLTSRPDEYEQAVRDGHQLVGATVVRLSPLRPRDLAAFLPRTTRAVPEHERDEWDPVLAEVRAHPSGPVARVLATPLMAGLARNVYSDTAADPAELLDADRFPDSRALADHLWDAFLPAVYDGPPGIRDAPGQRAPQLEGRWTSEQARRWLTALAAVASEQQGDLAWWRLGERAGRILVACSFALAFVGAVLLERWLAFPGTVTFGPIGTGLTAWQSLAVSGAVPVGFLVIMLNRYTPVPRLPERSPALGPVVRVLTLSFLVFYFGLVMLSELVLAGVAAVIFGAVVPLMLYAAVARAPKRPPASIVVRNPAAALRGDRTATLTLFTYVEGVPAVGLILVLPITLQPLALLVMWSTRSEVAASALAGAIGATLVLVCGTAALLSAWGRFALVRLLLAVTDRAPLRMLTFLADAHRRGVLRQHGAVYRFRHAELADQLLRRSDTTVVRTSDRSTAASGREPGGDRATRRRRPGLLVAIGTSSLSLTACVLGMSSVAEKLPSSPGPYRSVAPACELLFEDEEELTAARKANLVFPYTDELCSRRQPRTNSRLLLTIGGPYAPTPAATGQEIARRTIATWEARMSDPRPISLGAQAFSSKVPGYRTVEGVIVREGNLVLNLKVYTSVPDRDLVREYTRAFAEAIVLERVLGTVEDVAPRWPLADGA